MAKFGIEVLKQVATWKVGVIKKIIHLVEKAKKKQRVTGWDLVSFIGPIVKLAPILSKYEQLGNEWLDLDESEKQQLKQIVKNEFKVDDSKAEEIAQRTFYVAMEMGDYITFMVKNVDK